MDRRTYLLSTAGLITGITGCSTSGTGDKTNKASGSQSTTQLDPPSFQATWAGPSTVPAGNSYNLEIVVENIGERRGIWEREISVRAASPGESSRWDPIREVNVKIPPGETTTLNIATLDADRAGVVYAYRISHDGPTHRVEFSTPTSSAVIS